MGNLTIGAIFVLSLNVLLFLSQASIMNINPEGTNFYTHNGTILASFEKGDNILDTESSLDALPENQGAVTVEGGNIFTDVVASIKGWVAEKTGLRYVYNILSAPYNMLKMMGLPNAFVFAIGTLWYGVTLISVILVIWGRN